MKYSLGQKVWFLFDGKAVEKEIRGIVKIGKEFLYSIKERDSRTELNNWDFEKETQYFASKADLIASL